MSSLDNMCRHLIRYLRYDGCHPLLVHPLVDPLVLEVVRGVSPVKPLRRCVQCTLVLHSVASINLKKK